MSEYRVRIELVSPLLAPSLASAWQADTVFGHVCWASARLLGSAWLARFLAGFHSEEPPLILSNGYPSGLLPRPLWPRAEARVAGKAAALTAMARAKRAGARSLATLAEFESLRAGQPTEFAGRPPPHRDGVPRQHSTIRRDGGVTEQDGLYALPESWTPEVAVYARATEAGHRALTAFAEYLEVEGYGKRRSAGYGAVRRAVIEPFAGFPALKAANGFVSLSNFIPASSDPTEGRWRVLAKQPKLGDERATDGNPHKRRLLFLEAGSCFRAATPRPWYGRIVEHVSPDHPDAVQYALSYAVSMLLPLDVGP